MPAPAPRCCRSSSVLAAQGIIEKDVPMEFWYWSFNRSSESLVVFNKTEGVVVGSVSYGSEDFLEEHTTFDATNTESQKMRFDPGDFCLQWIKQVIMTRWCPSTCKLVYKLQPHLTIQILHVYIYI